ncbi:hypothetical protein [Streptomyces sp. ADI95-16]|uniref:hypothetical protein n=1 Tax=Streptomyces sp. ADI95-16 TaxID=1522758 RepID=UPI0013DE0F3F|nr:hypothetical protein [Streptomyces sp. ADI95-16]
MTAGSAGVPGGVERGESGTTDVVLRAGGASWLTVRRSLGNASLTALGTGLLGLALVLPVAVIVLFSGAGWATVGVVALWMVSAAVAAGFAGALAAACFRVYRIRFSAAGDPPGVRLVRGLGSGPWRLAEDPDRLRLEQEIQGQPSLVWWETPGSSVVTEGERRVVRVVPLGCARPLRRRLTALSAPHFGEPAVMGFDPERQIQPCAPSTWASRGKPAGSSCS